MHIGHVHGLGPAVGTFAAVPLVAAAAMLQCSIVADVRKIRRDDIDDGVLTFG